MTENADVEWLRENWHEWVVIEPGRGQRLLAHIDQLEEE